MNKLTRMPFTYNDTNQEKLWGNGWNKLTPKQKELVSEILRNLKQRSLEVW